MGLDRNERTLVVGCHTQLVRMVCERGEELARSLEDPGHLVGLVLTFHVFEQGSSGCRAQRLASTLFKASHGALSSTDCFFNRVPLTSLVDVGTNLSGFLQEFIQTRGSVFEPLLLVFELLSRGLCQRLFTRSRQALHRELNVSIESAPLESEFAVLVEVVGHPSQGSSVPVFDFRSLVNRRDGRFDPSDVLVDRLDSATRGRLGALGTGKSAVARHELVDSCTCRSSIRGLCLSVRGEELRKVIEKLRVL